MISDTQKEFQEDRDTLFLTAETSLWQLIVWNDEVNTFAWVIESLVEICHHTYEQAEQCSLFIHYKGKYAVQHGEFDKLRPMCEALLDRSITATVEAVAKV